MNARKKALKDAGREDTFPDGVADLTREQAKRILKEDFYDQYRLKEIEDDRLAHQLLDIYANTKTESLRTIVQGAVHRVMRDYDLYGPDSQPFQPTDPIGPRTRERLNWLVSNGFGRELRNELVMRRLAYLGGPAGLKSRRGLVWRVLRFLEDQRPD